MTQLAQIEEQPTVERGEMIHETPANLAVARVAEPAFSAVRGQLRVFWRYLIRRATSKVKKLAVQETAALGDRRFISVVRFERQRYLIASSPSSVTLLACLSDESAEDEETGKYRGESGEKN